MKKGWTTTKLITIGGLACLDIILALSGGAITTATGIPLAGGIINNLIENSFIVFCLFLINQFGTGLLFRSILSIIELPLPLLGTPGFSPKIIIGIVAGLIADIIYLFCKKNRKISAFLVGGLTQIWIIYSVVFFGKLMKVPGIEKTTLVIASPPLVLGAVILGGIGGLMGFFIFEKVKNTAVITRIQQ